MPVIKIDQFGGIMPRQHPTLLPDGMAITAHNCRLKRGKLIPLRQPSETANIPVFMEDGLSRIADAASLHVWRKADGSFDFLAFKGVTWMAPGNIADDEKTRVVVSGCRTGGDTPDEPVVYARVGGVKRIIPIVKTALAKPDAARTKGPIIEVSEINFRGYVSVAELIALTTKTEGDSYTMKDAGTVPQTVGTADENIVVAVGSTVVWDGVKWVFAERYNAAAVRYTNFFWTWVDAYGYESPASPPSDEVAYLNGDAITISGGDIPQSAVSVRVYKAVAGTEAGRIQFVYEVVRSVAVSGFQFRVKDEDAGEVMPEIEAPPEDLTCIHDVPGGFYCGFSPSAPKTVCFSDIDLLYSWPIAYRYDVADNLVALAVTSNSVFALTDGWPYVISGTAPESMSVAKLAGPAACVSSRGVCVYRNAVYYVSNVGLMTIYNSADAGTVCANLTDKIFTKDQWLALNPKSCIMGQYDGALRLFFRDADGRAQDGLVIDLLDNMQIAVTTHDEAARCLCTDNAADKLYYVREVR